MASSSTFFSASWTRKSSMAFSTMRSMIGGGRFSKWTTASRRLRNSGVKARSTASERAESVMARSPKPMRLLPMSRAPALLVMMRMTLRKSALRPWLSVRVA